jgi:hypothetical protein
MGCSTRAQVQQKLTQNKQVYSVIKDYLTLFQETSLNFLISLKPLLFYIEEVLLRVCWDQWFEMRLQLPRNYGIFGTIWTTVEHNPSFT